MTSIFGVNPSRGQSYAIESKHLSASSSMRLDAFFARRHGFENFDQMLQESTTVIFDDGIKYLGTKTVNYFLAWLEDYPEYPLGDSIRSQKGIESKGQQFSEVEFRERLVLLFRKEGNLSGAVEKLGVAFKG